MPPETTASKRVVAIGDLNASMEVLLRILRGLRLIDAKLHWQARETHLIQIGDIFNRGAGAREAFALLRRLQREAPKHGSKVTVLLGNHEVMTAMGNEAYCSEDEYLSFATKAERKAWPGKVQKAMWALYGHHEKGGPIMPLFPRHDAWKALNAPGQAAMRRMLGPKGRIGRKLRSLPVAITDGDLLFVHGGISPQWAKLGIDGINAEASAIFNAASGFYNDLDAKGMFRSPTGPLWHREYALSTERAASADLGKVLKKLGVAKMVVGHTMTSAMPGGSAGAIKLRHRGALVGIDVGLGRDPENCAALVVRKGRGEEWTPKQTRTLWEP